MTRPSTVPSPTPASNSRSAGGRGWMLAISSDTRFATTHFSEQVLTNSRYFCRLSKKRKLRCGSGDPLLDVAVAAAGAGAVIGAVGRGGSGITVGALGAVTD